MLENEKPKIKFALMPDQRWYKHYDAQGNEISDKAIISKMYATAYLKTLEKLFTSQIANDLTTVKGTKKEDVVITVPAKTATVTEIRKEKDFGLDDFI